MKRTFAAAGFALLLLISTPRLARTVNILGTGTSSCGFWLELRTVRTADTPQQWVLGYLSGKAIWTGNDLLKDVDAFAVWYWLDNYCKDHPTNTIEQALKHFPPETTPPTATH